MAERNPSDDQAAFGVFPQLKRNRSQQDREAAKNIPIAQARGMVAGLLGLPADTINMIGAIRNAGRSDKPFSEIPYGSEHFLETLPLKDESPMGQAMGALGSFTPPVGTALKGAKAAGMGGLELINRGMFGEGPLRNFVPQHQFVMKPSNKANWLSGPNIHVPEGDAWRFKTSPIAGETPAQRIPHHEELLKDPTLNQDQLDRVKYQLEQTKGEAALDKWADSALMGYFKGQLASPEDPVRLMIDRNYANIEAKFAKDQERATKMAQRAEAELDPRKQANMKRQADTMRVQAKDDREIAMQNISHLPPEMLQDIVLDPKSYIKEERVKAGYPAEGLGTTDPSRKWEHQADEAVKVTRAGDIQAAMDLQPKIDKALQEQLAVYQKVNKEWGNLLRDKGLDEKSIASLIGSMPRDQKAEAVGMLDDLRRTDSNYLKLLDQDRSFPKFAAKDNPQVANLNPETNMYSGYMGDLGFEHVMDVLRQDLAAQRIRPDQLNKLSVEQAVKRTQEYNLDLAKKMNADRASARANLPVYKEYPEGYKWVQLNQPGNFAAESQAMGHSVKGYEPPKKHPEWVEGSGDEGSSSYGLGGWEAIKSGRAKIYSLVDSKGAPHATIEVASGAHPIGYSFKGASKELPETFEYNRDFDEAFPRPTAEQKQAILSRAQDLFKNNSNIERMDAFQMAANEVLGSLPAEIRQIKGKGNAKPIAEYTPYVQDFVKSGEWTDIGDLRNADMYGMQSKPEVVEKYGRPWITQEEYDDWFQNQLKPTKPPEIPPTPEGMKRGGVVISNNPDTMMLAVNNQKLAKGGKVVKFVEDVAPAAMEKLAMMFGNKLPLNMSASEVENLAKRFPAPSVDRINMNYKDVTKRVPELTEAAQKLQAGELDRETYAKLVQAHKPVTPYDFVPKPATAEEARGALREDARDLYGIPSKTLEAGSPVGLRLDIPAYRDSGVWVPTIHEQDAGFGAGKKIGHESVASVLNPEFGMSEKAALSIASGKPKGTIATIKGDWNPTNEAEAVAKAKEYLKHPEWRQVGMDPERHSFFYDRETMAPVVNAEEVIQIGPLVLAKNPKYGKPEDFKYADGGEVHMAGGGALAKLLRAAPKTSAEIEAIAQRMAPQMLGEFVRTDKGAQSVAGKTQKQFAKEKEMVHDIRPTGVERPLPKPVDIEELKGNVMIGIPGDPTISGQTVHSIGGIPLESPSPQHGGPLYGLGREDAFWASGLGAANRVQNLAREAALQYDKPVLGKYIMMGPESINYAQHFADANLSAIDPSKMSKAQLESFNNLIRHGSVKSGPRPSFPGVENPAEAYLHFSVDPELRKHFNALMQMPTVVEKHGLPSGIDVRHAITEPDLRDLEVGVTGKSIGRLRPDVKDLNWSEHPTYSHDIPGEFLGSSKYPIPYELSFPDTVKSVRENPKQAPQEFGSLKMVGPRQIIDQQMIDEIKQYEEQIKKLTGKKAGGAITGDDLIIEERPL